MKKLIYGGLFLALVGIGVGSCKKENLNKPTYTESNLYNNKIKEFDWKAVDYEKIGTQHNDFMIQAFDIHNKTGKIGIHVHSDLNFGIDKNLQKDIYIEIQSKSIEEQTTNVYKHLGANAKKVYDDLRGKLYSVNDYSGLVHYYDSIKLTLSKFQGLDYGILMSYIEVGKASAYLWFPETEGGSGLGTKYLLSATGETKAAPPHRTTVERDVLGASTSMVGWALTGGASFGPWGALGGFLAGTVFGAVSGSVIG